MHEAVLAQIDRTSRMLLDPQHIWSVMHVACVTKSHAVAFMQLVVVCSSLQLPFQIL